MRLLGVFVFVQHFLDPLLLSVETEPYPILNRKTIQDLFQNIAQIHSFSNTFLAALSSCIPLPVLAAASTPTSLPVGLPILPTSAPPSHTTSPLPPSTSPPESPSPAPHALLPILADLTTSTVSTLRATLTPRNSPRPLSLPTELSSPELPALALAPISKVLAEHAPFMSLYHPFISNFATSSKLLSDLRKEGGSFAKWLNERERQHCKGLRVGDYLLSVVQRVPRYLLLIKDLLKCTSEDDAERAELEAVLVKVEKSQCLSCPHRLSNDANCSTLSYRRSHRHPQRSPSRHRRYPEADRPPPIVRLSPRGFLARRARPQTPQAGRPRQDLPQTRRRTNLLAVHRLPHLRHDRFDLVLPARVLPIGRKLDVGPHHIPAGGRAVLFRAPANEDPLRVEADPLASHVGRL